VANGLKAPEKAWTDRTGLSFQWWVQVGMEGMEGLGRMGVGGRNRNKMAGVACFGEYRNTGVGVESCVKSKVCGGVALPLAGLGC
jgi:hypothetical protein